MASRILHYVVALEIAKQIKIADISRFTAGNLLPDASSHSDGSYPKAHFSHAKEGQERRGINWAEFVQNYKKQIVTDELYLGYLCHLIADAVWLNKIADSYVRIYTGEERTLYRMKGYQDFQKLNGIMTRTYGLIYPDIRKRDAEYEKLPVDGKRIEQLFQLLEEDFNADHEYGIEALEIYPYEAVVGFIKESVQVCIAEICALKQGREMMSPEVYYVKR